MLSHYDSIKDNTIYYLKSTNSKSMEKLSAFIKYIEHKNPYSHKDKVNNLMWKEQCTLNFPILYLASISLYIFAKKNNCTKFLFATRDCCQWYKLFKAMFPNEEAYYFNTSRIMFETALTSHNSDYKKYVKSLVGDDTDKTVYIDIHGTGKRAFRYFKKEFSQVPFCFMLSSKYHDYSYCPDETQKYYNMGKFTNVVFESRGSPIEMLNYDLVGTMRGYNHDGPIRSKLEYSYKLIKTYHDCIDFIISKIKPLRVENIIDKYDQKGLYTVINKIFNMIKIDKPIISKYIDHIGNHHKKIK